MRDMHVLLLAGTAEARELSRRLEQSGIRLTTSLAGATDRPAPQGGKMRRGGFGGVAGLSAYVKNHGITHIIDATHPFAATMSSNAAITAAETGTSILQVLRPPWPENPDWTPVATLDEAARVLPGGARVFLSTGRNSLQHFQHRDDVFFLARVIDDRPGDCPLPNGVFLNGRPPFAIQEETSVLQANQIDTLVSRNSGGTGGIEKLVAAEALGLTIVMVARPELPKLPRVETVDAAIAWVQSQ